MQHQIIGTTMPVLEVTLSQGESVVSESGRLSWMSPDIQMETSLSATGGPQSGGGKLFGALKRMIGGGTLFASTYTATGPTGLIAFATTQPGQILPVSISPTSGYLVHRHGFLASTPGIELTVGFQQSFGAGLFGGEGFILQRLSGQSDAWVQLQGEIVKYDLQPGQAILAHPAHVGMFTDGMSFTITTVPGLRNKFFGDEFFLCQLVGPGSVWLQSLTLPGLAADLIPYLPQPRSN
jgi:uncharacterized protein (TIGR00266 family)